jgi:hypothetical protein
MDFEGAWWVLVEEEPLDVERSRLYELSGGGVFDGRTRALLGSYRRVAEGADLTLADPSGDSTVVQLRTATDPDHARVTFTTAGYELYRASLPTDLPETAEEEVAREDWEDEKFGLRLTYGSALRDSALLRESLGLSETYLHARTT